MGNFVCAGAHGCVFDPFLPSCGNFPCDVSAPHAVVEFFESVVFALCVFFIFCGVEACEFVVSWDGRGVDACGVRDVQGLSEFDEGQWEARANLDVLKEGPSALRKLAHVMSGDRLSWVESSDEDGADDVVV